MYLETTMLDLKLLSQPFYRKDVADCPDFYFEKAQDALNEWKAMSIDSDLLKELLGMQAKACKERVETDSALKNIKDAIYKLVAYCDVNAAEKNSYNEYDDKRTVAKAGIRQHAWVVQWLKFKQEQSSITESIQNIVAYLENPEQNFPILSEDHKNQISRNLLGKDYDRQTFSADLMAAFDSLGVPCTNASNKSYLYSRMFYSYKKKWDDAYKIKGLVARDSTDWKEDYRIGTEKQGCSIMWRHNLPSNGASVLKSLRRILDDGNSFSFYIVEKNLTAYKATVIDFSEADDYSNKADEWEKKNPYAFEKDFENYCNGDLSDSSTKSAKIAYLVSKFEYIPKTEQLNINDCFKYAGSITPSVTNYVAFTDILTPAEIKMNQKNETIARLLEKKKNLILQGAPGTGKTYTTASIALKVLGIQSVDWEKHEAVMKEYDKLIDAGRIAFTTFHQSMDYEDFVEGYKPVDGGTDMKFVLKPGVFRTICERAKDTPCVLIIDEINRGNISKIFGELITLLEADKRDGGNHRIQVNLTYSQKPFSVPANLYIIGTMNTTDRSVGGIDYALRRRFAFYTLKSDRSVVEDRYSNVDLRNKATALFDKVEDFLKDNPADMKIDDLMPGHSYFMADDIDDLANKADYELIPLVKEYAKDGIIEVSDEKLDKAFEEWRQILK